MFFAGGGEGPGTRTKTAFSHIHIHSYMTQHLANRGSDCMRKRASSSKGSGPAQPTIPSRLMQFVAGAYPALIGRLFQDLGIKSGWLAGWLASWQAGKLASWQAGWLLPCLAGCPGCPSYMSTCPPAFLNEWPAGWPAALASSLVGCRRSGRMGRHADA